MKNFFEDATIICLDGLDCSGKETISEIIQKSDLIKAKYDFIKTISFPNYQQYSTYRDLISNLLDKDTYKFHNDNDKLKDIDKILFEARMFYYNIYNALINVNRYSWDMENSKKRLFIMDRYWQSNLFYQTAKYLMQRFPEDKQIEKHSEKIMLSTVSLLFNEASNFNFPKVDKYFYIKMPIEFIKFFLSKKANKDENENNLNYLIYTKSFYDKYLETVFAVTDDICSYTINTEYENHVYNEDKIEIKTFTDKKDGRLVYAENNNKLYRKLKTTEEIANEIINTILEER